MAGPTGKILIWFVSLHDEIKRKPSDEKGAKKYE